MIRSIIFLTVVCNVTDWEAAMAAQHVGLLTELLEVTLIAISTKLPRKLFAYLFVSLCLQLPP